MNKGQILPGSPFGSMLTALALNSQFIVEIGTLTGEGSTLCLYNGMQRPDQRSTSIEAYRENALIAQERCRHDHRVQILHGTVVAPAVFPELKGHAHPEGRQIWESERDVISDAPLITEDYFDRIDLLLIDGGEFGAYEEFLAIGHKSKVIALDDSRVHKNARTREHILKLKNWDILRDEKDRNGWFVARRKQ